MLLLHLLVFSLQSKSPPLPLFRDGLNEQHKNYELEFCFSIFAKFALNFGKNELDNMNVNI